MFVFTFFLNVKDNKKEAIIPAIKNIQKGTLRSLFANIPNAPRASPLTRISKIFI